MKVIIVGCIDIWAIENYYAKYLQASGLDVLRFNYAEHYEPGLLVNRIMNRLGIKSHFRSLNDALVSLCANERPDVVWVFKGVELYISTLERIKDSGPILVNYNPDHPLIRTAVSHGGKHMEKAITQYDAHFCYSTELKQYINTHYGIKSFHLPFAYEPGMVHDVNVTESKDEVKVCMIGNADKIRGTYIKELIRNGIPVIVFGNYWTQYLTQSKDCLICPPMYGYEFWRTMLDYRVQLNVFRPHNEGSHNMRTFEIPSVGGLELAPFSEEHGSFFTDGLEIWMYKNMDQMVERAFYLLQLHSEDVVKKRRDSKDRSFSEAYTYERRANFVKHCFDELVKDK